MKRSRGIIAGEILELCQKPATVTQIVYQVNLNFRTVKPYLKGLKEAGLISEIPGRPVHYKTTEKGIGTLEHIKAVGDLFKQLE